MGGAKMLRRLALGLAACAAAVAAPMAAAAQEGRVVAAPVEESKPPPKSLGAAPLPNPGSGYVFAPVTSFAALRFKGIERQTKDLSCGAAALGTLMRFYFGFDDATEDAIIRQVLTTAGPEDKAKIATSGFSMLELKHYAEARGLVAGGFKTNKPEDLRKLRAPAIALVNSRGYKHFVVIRHVRGDEVAFADPVFGNRVEKLETFAKRWNNVILVVVAPGRVVNASFMEAPNTITDPRATQLYVSRYQSPSLIPQAGDFF
jgi:predicted double-glycine peptidase